MNQSDAQRALRFWEQGKIKLKKNKEIEIGSIQHRSTPATSAFRDQ